MIALLVVALVYWLFSAGQRVGTERMELQCIARIRAASIGNPILSHLKDTLDGIAQHDKRRYRKSLHDSTLNLEIRFGSLILMTSDSSDGFITRYSLDSVLNDGIAWGRVGFYRYHMADGIARIMEGTTGIAISGKPGEPIPPWEKFDEYAYKFMRSVGMINENCEVVDSAITAPDGDPKSATFHKP